MCIANLLVAFDFIRRKNEPHDFTLEKCILSNHLYDSVGYFLQCYDPYTISLQKPNLILNVDGFIGVAFVDLLNNCGCFTE